MATAQEVIKLNRENPTMTSRDIAALLHCHPGYVRATGQRQGLIFYKKPRAGKAISKTVRKYNLAHHGVPSEYVRLSEKEELQELFYEFFDEFLADHASFEATPKIAEDFYKAMQAGQSITGFLMGDPFPARQLRYGT